MNKNIRDHLLGGVSYIIPFVAGGGILIAIAIALAPMTAIGPDFSASPFLKVVFDVGTAAFALLIPVLAGYISYSMADRSGLVPGFIGGYIASEIGAGFLGGLVAGLLAGLIVGLIKKIKVPQYFRPIMPILVIPAVSSLIVGFIMFKIVGVPLREAMEFLTVWLREIGTGNKVILAAILGAMIAFDMGGPVNKVAFFFAAAMIQEGNFYVMGAVATAICIPPLGLGLATIIGKKYWTSEERDAGCAALVMGMIGITEGAIPFAASDPLRIIPTIMAGSIIGSIISMLGGVMDHAPHGGPIVLPVVGGRLIYIIAILTGVLTVALITNILKRLPKTLA